MAALQNESPWRYRTFYYSSSPSWHELQQLQVQHHSHIMAMTDPGHSSSSSSSPSDRAPYCHQAGQQRAAASGSGWVVPAQLQQRLLRRQQALQQLLSAVHLRQSAADMPVTSASQQAANSSGLITVHSSANMFEGGTGCHMWDAGFLLAEFVLNNRSLFAGGATQAAAECTLFPLLQQQ